MRQFILPDEWEGGRFCVVEGEKAKYLGRVLRLTVGTSFPARDAHGRPWLCTVAAVQPGEVKLEVAPPPAQMDSSSMNDARAGKKRTAASDIGADAQPARIILVQALLKGPRMDMVIRQAAETGVAALVPLSASRSLPSAEEGRGGRSRRWNRILREALQQSGSPVATVLAETATLDDLPSALDGLLENKKSPRILLHETPLAQSTMHGYLTGADREAVLCVGPEGGFSPQEVERLVSLDFKPLRFRGAVLRAETAALYAVAAAQIVISERSSWSPNPASSG
jgi:16S rRNA (uracil1498-N3)-methyltransferase